MNAKTMVGMFAAGILAASGALAQTAASWPSKPLRWVVPFAPGGPTDIVARLGGVKLAERIGQPVIIENRAGAAGNIGTEAVAKAAPDGHTILYVVPSLVTNPFFFKASPDPKSLAPVIQIANSYMALLASTGFAPRTVAEVVAHIKAKPGAVSCGSGGAISMVGCELLRSHVGAAMIMVNYKGLGPALNALLSGEINLLIDNWSTSAAHVRAGRARAIATVNTTRGSGILAEVPSIADTIPDFAQLVTWHGVMAPAATPGDIVQRLNRELAAVINQPDMRTKLTDMGFEIVAGPAESFGQIVQQQFVTYGKVLKAAGVTAE